LLSALLVYNRCRQLPMRHILTTLILLTGLLCCKEKVGQTDLAQTKIEDQLKGLKKTKETKFGGGDVWGTTYIFNNADSSVTKVLVDYDAGDYGKGRNEYLIVNNILIYQRDSIVDQVINKSPLDSSEYKLQETISYFNKDSTGTRTSKSVYSMTFEFNGEKIKELKNKETDSLVLTKTDYLKMLSELKDALTRTIMED
jgi:hypothetical protein